MNKYKIAFIGGGNIAYAIVKNMLSKGIVSPEEAIVSDLSKDRLSFLQEDLKVNVTEDNITAVENSDMVILAVKPQVFRKDYELFVDSLEGKCVVSIMAGVTVDELEETLPDSARVLRTMPNMPAIVGEGMTAICKNSSLTDDEKEVAESIFKSVGRICYVEENLIDAVIGISGSGPAYAFMFIEALADAGVLHGLPRELSYELAAQLLKGSAATVLETGIHPGELKDRVCSPGGTTIVAVKSLEKNGFRGAVIEAVDECVKKAKELSDE